VRDTLLPAGIDVQSRKYGTEDDPRGIPDLFVSIDYTIISVIACMHA
jgi:hypothetical protein